MTLPTTLPGRRRILAAQTALRGATDRVLAELDAAESLELLLARAENEEERQDALRLWREHDKGDA
jgi:hypothetical protein